MLENYHLGKIVEEGKNMNSKAACDELMFLSGINFFKPKTKQINKQTKITMQKLFQIAQYN